MNKYSLKWELGYSTEKQIAPKNFISASVPGSVQLDYNKVFNLGDYNYASNYIKYAGLEDLYWTYFTKVKSGKNRYLVSKGIDYKYEVYFNDQLIYEYEGMYKGFRILLPDSDIESLLKIIIFPAPKAIGEEGRSQARESTKQAVNYGWDFQARLIPLGIWNDLYIEEKLNNIIVNQEISYELTEDLKKCYVKIDYETTGGQFNWSLNDVVISSLDKKGTLEIIIDNPILWYPREYGNQHLYINKTWISNSDEEIINKIGFRRSRLITKPMNWHLDSYEGCTSAKPPISLEINGIEVFAKGSNYVIPDVFYSKMNKDIYKKYIDLALEANFNVLRTWGGCIPNKDSFFELCDAAGIMILQEFPLACNNYPDTPNYLKTLKSEATAIIKNLKKFASVVLYSGGNELFESWSMMTEQSKALRMLNSLCLDLDENTPFVMSLPIYGVIHGSYGFLYRNQEPQQVFRNLNATAYTEFGVPSLSSKEIFNKYIPNPEKSIEERFGIKAWPSNIESWSCKTQVESYLGKVEGLDDLIEKSRLLQGIVYKQIYEEVRWQKESASMAINWNFCDSWPTYANNSIIDYEGNAKPALKEIGISLKPKVFSIKTDAIRTNNDFKGFIGLLNDGLKNDGCNVEIILKQNDFELKDKLFIESSKDYKNSNLVEFKFDLKDFKQGLFKVMLRGEDYDNEYYFIKS